MFSFQPATSEDAMT